MPHFHSNLSQLREIGWSLWNPIGLEGPPDTPADEYDSYLVCAAGMIEAGRSDDDIEAYLIHSAEVTMGMARSDRTATSREAARQTAAALRVALQPPLSSA